MKATFVSALRRFVPGALAFVTILLVALTVSGATYEYAMRQRAAEAYPPRGTLVAIDRARRLQLDCRGVGAPTVVLESGLDNLGSLSWSAVHDSIARGTRTCAYSRSGIMWSDRSTAHFTVRRAATDLHDALVAAGEAEPLVMVGHSIGGAYALNFAAQFPEQVAGLVLVDPSHPAQFDAFRAATGKSLQPPTTTARIGAALAWTGVLRLLPDDASSNWPLAVRRAAAAHFPTSLAAVAEEAVAIPATLNEVRTVRDLGHRPLIVLSATTPQSSAAREAMGITRAEGDRVMQEQHRLHRELARLSCNGRQELVSRSAHYIQFDRPDAVINAIREVVAATRAGGSARVSHR